MIPSRRHIALSLPLVGTVVAWLIAGNEASAQGPGGKPFENIYRRPAVSPYNQMSQNIFNPLANQNVYQQQVQPRLEQQQQMMEQLSQRQQVGRLQNQIQQIQQGTMGRQIDTTIRPTGHASTYMNYSHYYQMR